MVIGPPSPSGRVTLGSMSIASPVPLGDSFCSDGLELASRGDTGFSPHAPAASASNAADAVTFNSLMRTSTSLIPSGKAGTRPRHMQVVIHRTFPPLKTLNQRKTRKARKPREQRDEFGMAAA